MATRFRKTRKVTGQQKLPSQPSVRLIPTNRLDEMTRNSCVIKRSFDGSIRIRLRLRDAGHLLETSFVHRVWILVIGPTD